MIDWDEFDKIVDIETLRNDMKQYKKNGGNNHHEEVPYGDYEVSVHKLELVTSKKGNPMLSCWFKILKGDQKGRFIFMNQVVTQAFQIELANQILAALVKEATNAPEVMFLTYAQYARMIYDVAECIDNNFEYLLSYGKNKSGFNTFNIRQVYTLTDN